MLYLVLLTCIWSLGKLTRSGLIQNGAWWNYLCWLYLVSPPVTCAKNHLKAAASSEKALNIPLLSKATTVRFYFNSTIFQGSSHGKLRFFVEGLRSVLKYREVIGCSYQRNYNIVSQTCYGCNIWFLISKLTHTEDVYVCCHSNSLNQANTESISIKNNIHLCFNRNHWWFSIT